jgi:hypothetical protein
MLRPLRACWAYGSGSHSHAEHARQELMRALSIRVRNWCVHVHWEYVSGSNACLEHSPCKTCWAYTSGTDAYPEHTGQELMQALSACMRQELIRRLSVRIRNYMMPSSPKNKSNKFIFYPQSHQLRKALWYKNDENPSDRKSHTLTC